VIADWDAKLAQYRQALEAGTDPKRIARLTAEVQAAEPKPRPRGFRSPKAKGRRKAMSDP
jgi:hypothetical protein